ncbi:MAG TPA: glycosyltransferase [Methylomirabilota bacterium]|jgi:glycosyltransferase involved in cell wall biosynthesis|nr:glycosyltransferase [Methylomirabilota bacterium]
MRVALVHDWLTGMRGGERVLEALVGLYPTATIHTLVHVPGSVSPAIEARPIRTSFIQRLPGAPSRFRQYLPLFPLAMARFRFDGYDLVLSTSHCVALGVQPPPATAHVAYCFTPMRYAWDFREEYLRRLPAGLRAGSRAALAALRRWDRGAGRRAGYLACISRHVGERIRYAYGRDARVIYPPVRTDFFQPDGEPGDAFLCVSAFAPYKRLDVAVEAFTRLHWPLVVVGAGADEARLRRRAGPTVRFLGWQDDAALRTAYARCRAFVFPAEEEFGIAPLEAMAMGRPVIAYGRGALTETCLEGVTGLFFREQTPEALIDALRRFEVTGWSAEKIRAHALRFGEARFRTEMEAFVAECLALHREPGPAC